jgi:hypothetical protein
VYGRGSSDGGRRSFAEPEVLHLAGPHQLGHRADRLLDRHGVVDAVLVVEVDVVDAEPRERRVARRAHVFRCAANAEEGAGSRADVAELRGQHHLVAATLDGASDELLVGERAVHVGGVEEVHAEVERAVDGADRLVVVAAAVEF